MMIRRMTITAAKERRRGDPRGAGRGGGRDFVLKPGVWLDGDT
jgi:hypothetical protein